MTVVTLGQRVQPTMVGVRTKVFDDGSSSESGEIHGDCLSHYEAPFGWEGCSWGVSATCIDQEMNTNAAELASERTPAGVAKLKRKRLK